jgi:catechol 2,3-dioxygenase-like lactoylglutathione lyase family enzyme
MATRKTQTRRRPTASVRKPAAKALAAKRQPAAKKPASRPKAAAPRSLKRRHQPETLRLRELSPGFTVDDLDRSIRFYTEALGFAVKQRWERDGKLTGVMLVAGACEVALSQDDWAKGRGRSKGVGMRLYAETAQDLDALAARMRSKGAAPVGPKVESWGARTLSVTDPDGFLITFYRVG